MIKKLLNDQRGSVMLYLLVGSLGVILALTFSMLLGTMGKFSFSKESGDAYDSINAWEGCVQKFNKTADRFIQTNGCSPGDCLNFTTGTACTPCGSTDSKLTVGDCGCQMQYNEKQLVPVVIGLNTYNDIYSVFDITGSCNSASYTDLATLKTCLPSVNCLGNECGDDGCGGRCLPDTCATGCNESTGQCNIT